MLKYKTLKISTNILSSPGGTKKKIEKSLKFLLFSFRSDVIKFVGVNEIYTSPTAISRRQAARQNRVFCRAVLLWFSFQINGAFSNKTKKQKLSLVQFTKKY